MTPILGEGLREFFDRLPEAVKLLNREGKIQAVNPAGVHLLEADSAETLRDRALADWVPESHRAAFHAWWQRALAGSAESHEFPITGRRGTNRWLEARATPIPDPPGAATALLVVSRDITAHKYLEDQLRHSRERLHATLHSIGDAVIATDEHGRVEEINPVAERLTGWSAAEARGRPLEEVFRIVNEETRAPVESPVTRVLREGTVVGLGNHTLLQARDGRELPIADAGAPIRDPTGRIRGVVLVFRDQTAERAAQRAVAEARAFAESIVATVREPLLVLDAALRVVTANRSFYQTFQTTPAETLGRPVYELGSRQWDLPELRRLLEEILPRNTQFSDYEITHDFEPLGRRTLLLNARRLYREDGRTEMILLVLEDITARKQAEEALRELRERDRNVFELISDYAYTFRVEPDGSLRGEWVNEPFVRTFGYTIPEIEARGGWSSLVHPDDLPAMLEHARRVAGGRRDVCETRFVTRTGEVRWIRDHAVPVTDPATGRVVRIHGAAQDITARKEAEAALRASEERYRLISSVVSDYVFYTRVTPEGRLHLEWVAGAFEAITGYTLEEYQARGGWQVTVLPADRAQDEHDLAQLRAGRRVSTEVRTLTKAGEVRWVHVDAHPVLDPANQTLVGIYGAVRDITARKQAEAALRASEERFRRLFENSLVGIYRTTPEGRVEMANPALVAMLGYRSFEELARVNLEAEGFHPEYPRARFKALMERDGRVQGLESVWIRADGTTLCVRESAVAVRDATGRIVAYEGVVEDVTEQRRAEQALAEQGRDWQATFDASADAILLLDTQQRIKRANRTAELWFRQSGTPLLDRPCYQAVHHAAVPPPFCPFPSLRAHGHRQVVEFQHGDRWLELTADPVWGPGGEFAGAVHYFRDITERRAAQQALLEARQFARSVLDALPDHLCVLDEAGRILFTNAAWDRFAADHFGVAERVGLGVNYLTVCEQAAGAGGESVREVADALRALLAGERAGFVLEYPCPSPDRERWFAARASRFVLDGRPRVVLTHTDITERRRLEAQLLQAQKMEAIGRLAGGVAHDFNNILAVLLMQTELLLRPADLPARVREGLDQIQAATERAANLTRQLLLFSRKQVFQPRDLDLNQVVHGMAKMIRRVIGEDIHFELQTAAAPLPLRADPGMIEQVLLNLVVNARDAMPRGGRLVVRTGAGEVDAETARRHPEARPGWHVWLRVEDTGCGIPPEVLPHIFEPFFTTKEAGKGTGLGLATVYSVARQHQGWIEVETEVGRGTAFQVFLPGALQSAAGPRDAGPGGPAPGGNETILLVEDDPVLRQATSAVLEGHGYQVLMAEDGMQALQLWAAHAPRVALLLTDLVMPGGVTGRELARVLLHERPDLKVVYTSGYSAEWSGTEPHLGPNERFLPKPCPAEQLLLTLRRCLDG